MIPVIAGLAAAEDFFSIRLCGGSVLDPEKFHVKLSMPSQ